MRMDSEMIGILLSDSMHYTIVVSLEMSDEPNIIYNELRCRGYNVDVGLVELGGKDENGKFVRKQLEVDFVVNRPPYRVYIQSAFHMPTPEKE